MKCSKCYSEIANDSNFCEYCGMKTKNEYKNVDVRWALLAKKVGDSELLTSKRNSEGQLVSKTLLP